MESHGILECIKKVWYSNIALSDKFISNHDMTSRAAIKHLIQMQIDKGAISKWSLDKITKKLTVQAGYLQK